MRVRGFLAWLWFDSGRRRAVAAGAAMLLAAAIAVTHFSAKADDARTADDVRTKAAGSKASTPTPEPDPSVQLTDKQLGSIKIGAASEHAFPQERTAVGSIDFNENLAVQVFSPYQGKIIKAYAEVGDAVTKGQTLFTIESPDLIQADSNLIAAAGLLDLTTHALQRAKQLYEVQGIAEKDLQQAISDQQTAEGALKAGRDAVRVFGKSEAEIDAIVANRARGAAGPPGAARQCARPIYGSRCGDRVDAGQCLREQHQVHQRRAESEGLDHGLPGPGV
jgi:cobalt-zinc-cadmium efflux system membrane fusion protein